MFLTYGPGGEGQSKQTFIYSKDRFLLHWKLCEWEVLQLEPEMLTCEKQVKSWLSVELG